MRTFFCLAALLIFQYSIAQSVGIGTSTPHPSARLQINSINQGILIPAQTAAQRNAINNPATGLLVFQTDGRQGFYYYFGGAWINLTTGSYANAAGTAFSWNYGVVFTVAGSGIAGRDDGFGKAATFHWPTGMAIDVAGNIYVADQNNNKIRMITPTGNVTTFAGTGTAGADNGHRLSATFSGPMDVVFDRVGNMYVADNGNHRIRKIDVNGQVTTYAGSDAGYENGNGDIARFNSPEGIDMDAAGNIYVADKGNHHIRKIDPAGVVSSLAGGGTAIQDRDGPGALASFLGPSDVAVDTNGNVYVADFFNNKIRKVSPSGNVSTVAGRREPGSSDGQGSSASFWSPQGITIDSHGNLYVCDRNSHRIRKVTPQGNVSTIAGSDTQGAADGFAAEATFREPIRVAIDAFGDLYVADYVNHCIRKIILQ